MSFIKICDQVECSGSELKREWYENVEECAQSCYKKSSLFIFGTPGGGRCKNDPLVCRCICETAATSNRECDKKVNSDYDLYKYV